MTTLVTVPFSDGTPNLSKVHQALICLISDAYYYIEASESERPAKLEQIQERFSDYCQEHMFQEFGETPGDLSETFAAKLDSLGLLFNFESFKVTPIPRLQRKSHATAHAHVRVQTKKAACDLSFSNISPFIKTSIHHSAEKKSTANHIFASATTPPPAVADANRRFAVPTKRPAYRRPY